MYIIICIYIYIKFRKNCNISFAVTLSSLQGFSGAGVPREGQSLQAFEAEISECMAVKSDDINIYIYHEREL